MTKHKKGLIAAASFCGGMIAVTAFAKLGFNPAEWSEEGRAAWGATFVFFGFLSYVLGGGFNDQA